MVQFSVLNFIKSQWTPVPSAPKVDLDGQTVVVVGANTGIGFEAAMHFAKMGPGRLILACRSLSRGSAALDKLKATTGCETAELWLLDLSSFESVRAFADRIELEVQRLDILIANAAVVPNQFEETEDHWETSIQVNHIAPALLIILLMPKMFASLDESTKSPRIVIVSSSLHHHAKVPDNVFKSSTPLQVLSDKSLSSPFEAMPRYYLA
ncbi:NAD(P)-binding domain superfamily protein [Pleurotus pulmonarius]